MTQVLSEFPSPLAEGRELKLMDQKQAILLKWSPLAEGRELKLIPLRHSAAQSESPLAEGRELKWNGKRWTRRPLPVAPRGGA